jgi:hypothetical protein
MILQVHENTHFGPKFKLQGSCNKLQLRIEYLQVMFTNVKENYALPVNENTPISIKIHTSSSQSQYM